MAAPTWEAEPEFAAAFKAVLRAPLPTHANLIDAVVKLAIAHLKTNYKMVVHEVERFMRKAPATYRVTGLYMVTEICRYCVRKLGDKNNVSPRFAVRMDETLQNALSEESTRATVAKVVGIWRDQGLFAPEVTDAAAAQLAALGLALPPPAERVAAPASGPAPGAGMDSHAAAVAAAADASKASPALLTALMAMQKGGGLAGSAGAGSASASTSAGAHASAGGSVARPLVAGAAAPVVVPLAVFNYDDDEEDPDTRLARLRAQRENEERVARGEAPLATVSARPAPPSAATMLAPGLSAVLAGFGVGETAAAFAGLKRAAEQAAAGEKRQRNF